MDGLDVSTETLKKIQLKINLKITIKKIRIIKIKIMKKIKIKKIKIIKRKIIKRKIIKIKIIKRKRRRIAIIILKKKTKTI